MTDISITKNDVLKAQQEWADGIVDIGEIFLSKGDYQQRASRHIKAVSYTHLTLPTTPYV